MKRWLQLRVSALWLAAAPPVALWSLQPVREGTALSVLSGNQPADGELLAFSAYMGAYLCTWLLTPTMLIAFALRRALERLLRTRAVR